MRRAERLAILGAESVAEIHRLVAAAPPPPPELLEDLRHVLAPALQRVRARHQAALQAAEQIAA